MFNDQEKKDFCKQTKIRKVDFDPIFEGLKRNGLKLEKLSNAKDSDQISKQYLLGKGGQANVFNGINIETGENIAIKISKAGEINYQQIKEEQEVLKNIKYEIDVCISVLKLCQMSLDEEIIDRRKNNQPFTSKEIANLIFFAINALYEIHTNNIIHFDIKPSNILKSYSGEYKLTDFGMARKLSFFKSYTVHYGLGTLFFASPEQLEVILNQRDDKQDSSISQSNEHETPNFKFKYATDIFSMGVTLLQAIGVEMDYKIFEQIKQNQFDQIEQKVRRENKIFYSFIKHFMLQRDVELRSTAARLRQKFIQNFDYMISIEDEIQRIINIIEEYDTKNYIKDKHYAYLQYQLSQSMQFSGETKHIENAIEILQKIEQEEKNDLVLFYQEYCQKLIMKGDLDLALKYNQKSFEILQNLKDNLSQEIAYSFFLIGQNLNKLGQYEKALSFSQQSLEIRKIMYKDNHHDIFESINLISEIYLRLRKPNMGLEHALSGLKIIETIYYEDIPLIGKYYNIIGKSYYDLGIIDKAYEYFQKDLKMNEYLYSSGHQNLAIALSCIGSYYLKVNEKEKSLQYSIKSLEIGEKIFSNQNDQIMEYLFQVGSIFIQLSQYERALNYLLDAHQICKSIYKGNHPNFFQCLYYAGVVYSNLKDFQQSILYMQSALQMAQSLYFELDQNLEIYNCLRWMSQLSFELQFCEQSLEYSLKAQNIIQQINPTKHDEIYQIKSQIIKIYSKLVYNDKDLEYNLKLLENVEQIHSGYHQNIIDSLNQICKIYIDMKDYIKSLEYQFKILKLKQSFYEINHEQISCCLNQIGEIYYMQKNYNKAEEYIKKAFKMSFKEIWGDGKLEANYLGSLNLIYKHLGKNKQTISKLLGQNKKAEIYLLKSLQFLRTSKPQNDPKDEEMILDLILDYYEQTGDNAGYHYFQIQKRRIQRLN